MKPPISQIAVTATELTDIIEALTERARSWEDCAKGHAAEIAALCYADAARLYALAGRLDNNH